MFLDWKRAGHGRGIAARGTGTLIEIKWHDIDPETGAKRFLCAEKFARVWKFRWRLTRRGEWTRGLTPTRQMWEHVVDSLKRRYRRREGVSEEDIEYAEKILASVIRDEEQRRSSP